MNKYKLLIIGKRLNHLLDDLIKNNINLYYVDLSKDRLYITIDEKSLDKVINYKRRYKISIVNTYGKVKIRSLFSKYKVFIIGCFFCFLILNILSNIVFSIDVITADNNIKEMIIEDLELYGIKRLGFCVSYDKKELIEKKILSKEKESLEWISIKRIGTKYQVELVKKVKKERRKETNLRNIVAKKDAMIIDIDATIGEIRVKKNDFVKKGDVLISGIITKDEDPISKVSATGKVYGEVWYKVSVSLPDEYIEEKVLDRDKIVLNIKFLDKEIDLFSLDKYNTYKGDDIITFINENIIPFKVSLVRKRKTKVIKKEYTIDNSNDEAIRIGNNKINGILNDGEEIISSKVLRKTLKKSKIDVDIFYKIKQDITDYVDITNVDITNVEIGDDVKDE